MCKKYFYSIVPIIIVILLFSWFSAEPVNAIVPVLTKSLWIPNNPRPSNKLNDPPVAGIFSADGKPTVSFKGVSIGSSIAISDIDADGSSEVIFGSGPGVKAEVALFRSDGTLIRRFPVLDGKFSNGVNVAVTPEQTGETPTIFLVPRAGTVTRIYSYNVLGRLLSPSFLAYQKNFRNGGYIAAGDVTGDGKAEIVIGPGPGGHPTIKVFNTDGTLVKQYRQMIFPSAPVTMAHQSEGVQVAIIPDFNGDGVNDIAGYANGDGPMFTYYVHDARTGAWIDPWSKLDAKGDSINFYDENLNFDPTNFPIEDARQGTTFTIHNIGGKTRVLFTSAFSQGPLVLQTGRDDWKAIGAYSANWKGGVTAAAIDLQNNGVAEYVISPGTIDDSAEMLKNYDFTSPSILPKGVTHKLINQTVSTPTGKQVVSTIIVDLHNPKLKVLTLAAACNRGDRCVNPLSFYVKRAKGFAGINGSTFTPGNGGFLSLWYDSLRKEYEGTNDGGIAFDNHNRWYTDVGTATVMYYLAETYRLKYQPIKNVKALRQTKWFEAFQKTIGQKPSAHFVGWQMRGISTSFIGFKGGDMYIVHTQSTSAFPDVLKKFNFVDVEYMDGGGSVSQMYNGRYIAGPGRNIPNALVLSEK